MTIKSSKRPTNRWSSLFISEGGSRAVKRSDWWRRALRLGLKVADFSAQRTQAHCRSPANLFLDYTV